MGMSTHVVAFVSDEDNTYQKHAAVLRACADAGISELPKETAEYFGETYPEEYLLEERLQVKMPVHEYGDEWQSGFEIIVDEIPEGVHKIRFTNSW